MAKRHLITWFLVCDGARGRLLAHSGSEIALSVVVAADHPQSHGHTRDLGTDRPGRSFDSTGTGVRHAMAPRTDWHIFEKARFAAEMAAIAEKAASEGRFDRLVVVAPPRVLGDLREAMGAHAKAKLAGEVLKDLTHLNETELAREFADWIGLKPRRP